MIDLRVVRVDQVRLGKIFDGRERQIERCRQSDRNVQFQIGFHCDIGVEHFSVPKWSTDPDISVFSSIRRSPTLSPAATYTPPILSGIPFRFPLHWSESHRVCYK